MARQFNRHSLLGPEYGETELDMRRAKLRPAEQLVILSELSVGQMGAGNPEHAQMAMDQTWAPCTPSALRRNFKISPKTTLTTPMTTLGASSNSTGDDHVLTQYTSGQSGFRPKGPAIGLFAAQEIKRINWALFVDQPTSLNARSLRSVRVGAPNRTGS